jgi:hypothetical protein
MAQMQTLSARLPVEDVEWLASIDLPGASTPSDKIRALIARSRLIQQASADYQTSLAWARDLVAPRLAELGALEHREGVHSEAVRLVAEAAPQLIALLLSGRTPANNQVESAKQLEERLISRSIQLATALLRLSVAPSAPCFDASALDRHVVPLIQLSRIVNSTRSFDREKTDG